MERIKRKNPLRPAEAIGKKVLILGDVGSGKTPLTARIIRRLARSLEPREITVIDMAPEAIGEIGGRLSKYLSLNIELRYLAPTKVYAPRTMGITKAQVIEYAKRNRTVIEPLLMEFLKTPTEALIVNDITLYLHFGALEKIVDCMRLTETFVASAYYGIKLEKDHGTGISVREKKKVEKLATYMDHVVKLNGFT